MKAGKVPVNLSINEPLARAAQTYIVGNKRKGRANLSELTANLWIAYLRKKGVKLPLLLKNGRTAPK